MRVVIDSSMSQPRGLLTLGLFKTLSWSVEGGHLARALQYAIISVRETDQAMLRGGVNAIGAFSARLNSASIADVLNVGLELVEGEDTDRVSAGTTILVSIASRVEGEQVAALWEWIRKSSRQYKHLVRDYFKLARAKVTLALTEKLSGDMIHDAWDEACESATVGWQYEDGGSERNSGSQIREIGVQAMKALADRLNGSQVLMAWKNVLRAAAYFHGKHSGMCARNTRQQPRSM